MAKERSLEEEYGFRERKEQREERKEASRRDRSQYKKSDQKRKKQESVDVEHCLKGRVIGIASQEVTVDVDGALFTCVIRGRLKRDRSRMKNLVAIGDMVFFEKSGEHDGVISHVEERKTVLSRADNLSRRQEQVIAANIDQVLITMSVVTPPLKPFLIDRYIIAANKGNMTPVVVINKLDLLEGDPDEEAFYEDVLEAYRGAGVEVIGVSATDHSGLEPLLEVMKGKVSVFSGQSGVGKSSLINATTGSNLITRDTVKHTKKGAHTTTSACLLPLKDGEGWCVDTPGIKSFGVWNLEEQEIQGYFPEILEKGNECHFSSCTHQHEPNCAVLEAVENEEIHPIRYASYCQLMESIRTKHKRR